MIINTKFVSVKQTYDSFFLSFQTQLSASSWPSVGSWPQIMEDFKIRYKSNTFTEIEHLKHALDGTQCKNKTEYLGSGKELDDYRSKNFMKVRFSNTRTYFNTPKNKQED